MVRNREEVLGLLRDNRQVIRSFGVRRLGLFGSYVRGEGRPTSDLDFIVEFDQKSFDSYMDLRFFLEELFKRKVDLVLSDSIKPRLRAAILGEAVYAQGL